jgi:hypothetical protein
VLASLSFLAGTGFSAAFAHPYWQWWLYAYWYFSEDSVVHAWLAVSAVAAAVLPLVPVGVILYRHYRRIYGWTPWLAMLPLTAWVLAGAGLYLAVFTVLATVLFLIGTGLQGAYADPFWQWWLYALYDADDPPVRFWLEVSGVSAAILPLFAAGSFWYRHPGLVAGRCTAIRPPSARSRRRSARQPTTTVMPAGR